MPVDPALDHFRRQHGLITRKQALDELDMSESAVKRRVRGGLWLPVERGVYRSAYTGETWESRVLGVCLRLDAVASHRTAARLWDLDGIRWGGVEVTVSAECPDGRRRRDLILHESTQMDLIEVTSRSGVPTTDLARTLFDLCAVTSMERVEYALDSALRRKLVTPRQLVRSLVRHARRGRDGTQNFRALLERRLPDERLPDSRFNRGIAQLVERAGLPAPELEYPISDQGRFIARADLAWPRHRLAVEADSIKHHFDHSTFQGDRTKRNELQVAGWNVLAFTWRDYEDRPEWLVETVRKALALELTPRKGRIPDLPDGILAGG